MIFKQNKSHPTWLAYQLPGPSFLVCGKGSMRGHLVGRGARGPG